MSIVAIVIGVVVSAVLLGTVRQRRRDQRVLRAPSATDRHFIADQFEQFTRLPLSTAEDEDAWDAARDATFRRLAERVPDFAREVVPGFLGYFNDADVFRRDPEYRAARERHVSDFIDELRAQAT